MNQYIRTAERSDVKYLADNLRKEDVEECLAGGVPPLLALNFGFRNSERVFTAVDPVTGLPGAMFGVSDCEGWGKVWLLGTPAIEQHAMKFLRHSKPVLQELFGDYPALFNYTYEGNTLHHKWLRWLGFVFLRRLELFPENFFYEFVSLRKD